jgi:hypothetical protein
VRGIETIVEETRAAGLPVESWERLKGESAPAFAAFCAYRDFGPERSIRKALEKANNGEGKSYKAWRTWASARKWRERAAEYDRYLDLLKQTEKRKTIEAQGEPRRRITGKMLNVVSKKLDLMNPAELTQGAVTEWVQTAIKAEREAAGLVTEKSEGAGKQLEIRFTPEFEGL